MSKNEAELSTQCPCGHELKFWVKRPTYLGIEVAKVECKGCGSKFLVKLKIGNDRKIDIQLGVQELSEIAQKILRTDIDERNKAAAQKHVTGRPAGNGQNAGGSKAKGADKVN